MIASWQDRNEVVMAGLEPTFAGRVRSLLAHELLASIPILAVEGDRTWAQQDIYWAQGRTTPGKRITNARGGYSQHNFGLAVDLCPDNEFLAGYQLDWNVKHPVWQHLLAAAPGFGLAEGAKWRTFPDNPHFYPVELPGDTKLMRSYFAKGGRAAVWKWFNSLTIGAKDDNTIAGGGL